jgi:hypothetical protein
MTPKMQRALVTTLIILGVMFVGFFGLRTLRAFKEFRGHRPPPPFGPADFQQEAETDVELIRDWMTIPYIARMYQVPPKILFEALDIPHRDRNAPHRRPTVSCPIFYLHKSSITVRRSSV